MMAVVSEARPQQWQPRHLFGLKLIKVLSRAGFNRIPDNAVYPHFKFSLFLWIFKRAFSKHESVFNPAPNLTPGGIWLLHFDKDIFWAIGFAWLFNPRVCAVFQMKVSVHHIVSRLDINLKGLDWTVVKRTKLGFSLASILISPPFVRHLLSVMGFWRRRWWRGVSRSCFSHLWFDLRSARINREVLTRNGISAAPTWTSLPFPPTPDPISRECMKSEIWTSLPPLSAFLTSPQFTRMHEIFPNNELYACLGISGNNLLSTVGEIGMTSNESCDFEAETISRTHDPLQTWCFCHILQTNRKVPLLH